MIDDLFLQIKTRKATTLFTLHSFQLSYRITGEKLWFREGSSVARGVKRQLMPDKYRKVFCNKQIVCVEYHEISEEDEREVFQVRFSLTCNRKPT